MFSCKFAIFFFFTLLKNILYKKRFFLAPEIYHTFVHVFLCSVSLWRVLTVLDIIHEKSVRIFYSGENHKVTELQSFKRTAAMCFYSTH